MRTWPIVTIGRFGAARGRNGVHAPGHAALSRSAFSPPLRTRLLVLQATPFCNVACDYCYLPERDSRSRITLEVVRQAAARLVEDDLLGEELTVVWHAGEPLVVAPAFYDDAIAAIADEVGPGCRVAHSIQTNATLIDDRWCELFERHHVRVGVSLDGPRDLHDRHRKTRDGRGTYDAAMRGVAALQAHGVPFHVITVLTSASLDRADDLVDFFVAHRITDVGLNFDEQEGFNGASSMAGREADHRRLLGDVLERCMTRAPNVRIRELAHAYDVIAREPPAYRHDRRTYADNAQVIPFALVSVACDGTFSTFSPELLGQRNARYHDFALGNVTSESYLACTTRAPFWDLFDPIRRGVDACKQHCEYFALCGGGSPINKLAETDSFATTETLYCRLMHQQPIDVMLEHVEGRLHGPSSIAPTLA
jgi:uncharacterized protein